MIFISWWSDFYNCVCVCNICDKMQETLCNISDEKINQSVQNCQNSWVDAWNKCLFKYIYTSPNRSTIRKTYYAINSCKTELNMIKTFFHSSFVEEPRFNTMLKMVAQPLLPYWGTIQFFRISSPDVLKKQKGKMPDKLLINSNQREQKFIYSRFLRPIFLMQTPGDFCLLCSQRILKMDGCLFSFVFVFLTLFLFWKNFYVLM